MARDLLGGLSGLVRGLTSIMPQDDPDVRIFKVQSEANELAEQEAALYGEIGKKAVEQYGLAAFGELADRLKTIQDSRIAAQARLEALQSEKEVSDQAAQPGCRACSDCGHENPEGTKFCQECGAKLALSAEQPGRVCPGCGAEAAADVRFCNECGTRME